MAYDIHSLLSAGIEKFGDDGYIYERKGDTFEGVSFSSFASDVRGLAAALLVMGLADRKIVLFGENSYMYMVADIAVMGYVGVSATLSKEWQLHDLINSVQLLDAAAVIYSDSCAERAEALKERFPELVMLRFEQLSDLIRYDAPIPQPQPSDRCCKLIFSSGTTGMPKAVMLSQDNMFANWESLILRSPFAHEDRDYLFLPLSHTYAGICNFLYSLISGMRLYLCSDTKLIMQELQMVRPTIFCSVPLIYEKIYAYCSETNTPPAAVFGGCVRYLFSGGAYMRPEIRRFIKQNGLVLLEAYGLTETSSLISCEYPDNDDFTSAGTVMENIDIRIDSPDEEGRGEILVRGGNIFSEYYDNSEATAAAFTEDGWFRTGDIGWLDDRRLHLVGRKRRMILLSNGENVYPDEIEALFAEYPSLTKVKVYQRDGDITAALYTTSEIDADSIIDEVNSRLPKFSHIRSFEVIRDSIETRMK